MLTTMSPTVESVTRTDAGLASQLRVSVMRLARLLRHGESTVGQLAAQERVQPPSMTRTVNCLVDDGYAVRRPSETDRRSTLIEISEKGRQLLLADRRRRDAWLA